MRDDASAHDRTVADTQPRLGGEVASDRRGWRRIFRHLSVRLFFVLFGLLAAALWLYTHAIVREQQNRMMETVLQSADGLSDVIQRTTRAAMLRNQRTELHEMTASIGDQPGIDGVRVFNKQGQIVFSTAAAEIGTTVDKQAEACGRCHAAHDPPPTLDSRERSRIFVAADGHRVLGLIRPIPNAPDCATAACHAHPANLKVLGVLDVRMSLTAVDGQLQASERRMQKASLALVLVVALLFAFVLYRLVQRPVGALVAGTRAISAGQLDHRIGPRGAGELTVLAESFDRMTEDLQGAREENRRWAATLETQVRDKTEELRSAHTHLLRMDRMASLGKLAATVAHEINNPLAGILTYARLVQREADAGPGINRDDIRRYAETIGSETQRCGDIVRNLLSFARTSGAQFSTAHLRALVEASVRLVQHHFHLREIAVEMHWGEGDDTVECAAGEVEQALLAILVNASEATPAGGRVDITTTLGPDEVQVAVHDTGCGIPPEIVPHVFEPFYTTKSAAKGVGLGLAVVYGIMQRHGGRIDVQTVVGTGSTFVLVWPRRPPAGTGAGAPTEGNRVDVGGKT